MADFLPYQQSTVDVFDGTTWVNVFATNTGFTFDTAWTRQEFDISAFKNPAMKVRFGYANFNGLVYAFPQWSVDDICISVTASLCI